MATDTKATANVLPPIDPVPAPVAPDLPLPAAQGPVWNPLVLGGALMPAFLLMVFGACFIINPMAMAGHGAAAAGVGHGAAEAVGHGEAAAATLDEALLAFCAFWFGTVSILCRRFLAARLPVVANAPVYIVRFVQNCFFGPAPPPPPRRILEMLFW